MFDPRRCAPAKLVQLFDSSPLGEVITLARMRKHRLAAGFSISLDGETVDCLKYIAWLCAQRHTRASTAPSENETLPAPGSLGESLSQRRAEIAAMLSERAKSCT